MTLVLSLFPGIDIPAAELVDQVVGRLSAPAGENDER